MIEDVSIYRNHVIRIIDNCIKQNKRKFVLYPNGEITQIVRQVLEQNYNITPIFIVDNYKYDQKLVYNFEEAEKKTEADMYYLIFSDNDLYYDDIRENLKRHIRDEQIVDLFPNINVKEYSDRACELLKDIDAQIANMEI